MICIIGAERRKGGILQGLLIMIKILRFTLNEMGSIFEHFDQNYYDLIYVKRFTMLSASRGIWMPTNSGAYS